MKKNIPIIPSTGGAVSPNNIIGRDKEINLFWSKLEKQGLTLFAERRLGKSSILRKMEADGQKGFIPINENLDHWDLGSELSNRTKLGVLPSSSKSNGIEYSLISSIKKLGAIFFRN